MQSNILKLHALNNIWCEPNQDRHYVIQPERLTAPGGVYRYFTLLNVRVDLPDIDNGVTRNFFHVYQIGKLNDNLFNLDLADDTWYNVKDLAEYQGAQIDTYLTNGAMLLRSDVYLRNGWDNNFIVAIRINRQVDLGTYLSQDRLTGKQVETNVNLDSYYPILRFYKSAWFNSEEYRKSAADLLYPIRNIVAPVTNQSALLDIRNRISQINTHYGSFGMGTYYLDGFIQNELRTYSTTIQNKTLTYIWDSSIKARYFIPLKECPSFASTLDTFSRKYLVLLPEDTGFIEYMDDVEFHLVSRETDGSYKGVVINRLRESAIRMVTHNAYAIHTDIITALMTEHTFLKDLSKVHILVTVHKGGMKRGLISQASRVEELYRMNREEILNAMTGVNSNIHEWRAEFLENTNYTRIMGSTAREITIDMVEQAYGYNAATQVAANPLVEVKYAGEQAFVTAPAGLNIEQPWDSVVKRHGFIYDDAGLLVNTYESNSNSDNDIISISGNPQNLKYIEMYAGGLRGEDDDVIYNQDYAHAELDFYSFRCYTCPIVDDEPTRNWEDVTGSKYFTYTPATGNTPPSIKWDYDALERYKLYPAIKIVRGSQWYTHEFPNDDYPGYISFSIKTKSLIDGELVENESSIPPGQVDIFMNRESLVENIDYYIDWPRVTITRRPSDMSNLKVQIRMRGFCNPQTMKPFKSSDYGFVQRGVLSVDDEYDTRRDRNIRVVANGRLFNKDQVAFSEDTAIAKVDIPDGRAWAVTEHQVTIESFTTRKTVDFLMESYDRDQRVKAYLTTRVKMHKPENPYIQTEPWALTSPLLSALIHAFTKYQFLSTEDLDYMTFDAEQVKEWLEPYAGLIKHDPCLDDKIDPWYIKIYPHAYTVPVDVSSGQYRFLEYVCRNYLRNRVDLTPSVKIR